ncbi:MAG: rhomboid family intramembrane serine protease [Chloroflexi bacterium]|nr:rhomboid family intramembrane serine protease [Chloroflexota bacterium]MBA3739773.1 rhomboid family intramembrane serine protease [Chloroflexota bacterium]
MFPISDENERGHGLAFVSLAFIAINIAVFLFLQGAGASTEGEDFTYGYSAVPFEITNGVDLTEPEPITIEGQTVAVPQEPGPVPIWLTLFSSIFMHGGWLHLGGNMLFLWIFGDNVEHRIGHVPYLVFYLAAGVIASFAQILVDPGSIIPTLGASGAISGVLGAYLVMFPTNRVTVFLFRILVPVPAIVAIGMWAALQFVNGFGAIAVTEQTGGVAYMAHIGGFVAGVVAGLIFRVIFNEPRHPRGTPATAY